MKSLFFVFSIDYQVISHRQELIIATKKAGYQITVVAQNTGYMETIQNLGITFVDLPINRTGLSLREELKTFLFLYKLYKKYKPDIVYHVSIKVAFWGGLAAKLTVVNNVVNAINGLGVFFSNESHYSLLQKCFLRVFKFSCNRSNLITILQNNEDKQFFVDHKCLNEKQIRVIRGSGVNLNTFEFIKPLPKDKIIIVFTSRITEEKGVIDLIKAANILPDRYKKKVIFKIYGLLETNPKAVNKELLDSLCDDVYIQYFGFEANVKKVLAESDIVVLPSYYREGIPKSLIDAAAIGRPIVTTEWVGCKETVVDGYNGFLIPIKSPEAICEKLMVLIDSEELRLEMGKNSRKIAEKYFSIEDVIQRHLSIYEELITSKS